MWWTWWLIFAFLVRLLLLRLLYWKKILIPKENRSVTFINCDEEMHAFFLDAAAISILSDEYRLSRRHVCCRAALNPHAWQSGSPCSRMRRRGCRTAVPGYSTPAGGKFHRVLSPPFSRDYGRAPMSKIWKSTGRTKPSMVAPSQHALLTPFSRAAACGCGPHLLSFRVIAPPSPRRTRESRSNVQGTRPFCAHGFLEAWGCNLQTVLVKKPSDFADFYMG